MAKFEAKVKTEMDSSDPKLKLKLVFDKKNMKVLFAEANKEFVDFLLSLMCLPLGAVVNLLKKAPMAGSLGDLIRSVESIGDNYIQSPENIKSVLNPKPTPIALKTPLLSNICESENDRKTYICRYPYGRCSSRYMSDVPNKACPDCKKPMSFQLKFDDSEGAASEGFVKGVTYMVKDNLEVKPLSTTSSIALINSFNIRDLTSLEEMVVQVGPIQVVKLLRASLESKNVLTRVFLDKERN